MTPQSPSILEKAAELSANCNAVTPDHYRSGGIQPIDLIEAFQLGFNLGNVIKYVCRAGRKGDRLVDLEKAAWYLKREIDNEHGRNK